MASGNRRRNALLLEAASSQLRGRQLPLRDLNSPLLADGILV
jgi:hypothetical protein